MRTRAGKPKLSGLVAGLILAAAVAACGRSVRPLEQPAPVPIASLWQEPHDLESRDLFHGPGGRDLTPPAVEFTFVERKTTGTNPGYDVRDPEGRLWSVKLGIEAQSEVATSRILWALGFHQPPVYYVDRWRMTGDEAGEHGGSRFRAELPNHEVVGEWSWYENPFAGTRPFAALVTVNLLLNNWDLKAPNNKIYDITDRDGRGERRYVVRDLGGSLGTARQPGLFSWMPFMRFAQGSKNDLEGFQSQGFVKAIDRDRVEFDYRGLDGELVETVTVADLRWTCELLARLSGMVPAEGLERGPHPMAGAGAHRRRAPDELRLRGRGPFPRRTHAARGGRDIG
jgi:hypothetical protein